MTKQTSILAGTHSTTSSTWVLLTGLVLNHPGRTISVSGKFTGKVHLAVFLNGKGEIWVTTPGDGPFHYETPEGEVNLAPGTNIELFWCCDQTSAVGSASCSNLELTALVETPTPIPTRGGTFYEHSPSFVETPADRSALTRPPTIESPPTEHLPWDGWPLGPPEV